MISITTIIVIATVIVSYQCLNDSGLKHKLTFSPYDVKHNKKWWLIFTHGFVHADYSHLAMNMFTLYFLATGTKGVQGEEGVEDLMYLTFGERGWLIFLLLYFGAMAFATIPSIIKHGDNPNYRSVGASGAVSAIVFAFILFKPFKILLIYGIVPIPGVILGVLYIAFETYANKKNQTNIAHDAHIAGAIFGIVFLILMNTDLFFEFINQIQDKIST